MNCLRSVFTHITLVLTVLLTACAGKLQRPSIPAVLVTPPPNGQFGGSYKLSDFSTDLSQYNTASEDSSSENVATALRLRNKMVFGVLAEIDYVFGKYETTLFLNEGSFHVASDFVQLGLAAGSTVAVGARGKTILSALLSGVTGTNLSIDKNFFRQQTVEALISSMEANRDRIKTIILQQLKQDITIYPFQAARSDLIRYFFAGTLSGGLLELHQTAAANAKTQQTEMNQVQVANISVAEVNSMTAINAEVRREFAANDLTKVTAWLKAMGVVTTDSPSRDTLQSALGELGLKIKTDKALRQKYFDEARKAKLIQ